MRLRFKWLFIIIGLVLCLIIAGAGYYITHKSDNKMQVNDTPVITQDDEAQIQMQPVEEDKEEIVEESMASQSGTVIVLDDNEQEVQSKESEYKNIDGAHDFNNFENLIMEIGNYTSD